MVKTGEMISIEGLTVLSDTHCIELRTVGKLLYSCKNRPKFESYFWKEIEITAEWKGLMPPNYVQKLYTSLLYSIKVWVSSVHPVESY